MFLGRLFKTWIIVNFKFKALKLYKNQLKLLTSKKRIPALPNYINSTYLVLIMVILVIGMLNTAH